MSVLVVVLVELQIICVDDDQFGTERSQYPLLFRAQYLAAQVSEVAGEPRSPALGDRSCESMKILAARLEQQWPAAIRSLIGLEDSLDRTE